MKLFIKDENISPEIINYTKSDDYVDGVGVEVIGKKINMVSRTSFYNPYIEIPDLIPVSIGTEFNIKITLEDVEIPPATSYRMLLYQDGNYITDIYDNTSLNVTNNGGDLKFRMISEGTAALDLTVKLKIEFLIGLHYKEIFILNSDDIKITRQKKEMGAIGDINGSFSDDITVQFNQENYKSLGFFTPLSTSGLINYINGKTAYLVTDDNDIKLRGKLTIKEIIDNDGIYYVKLFFNDEMNSFFNKLDTEKINLPETIVGNDYITKKQHQTRDVESFEKNNEMFIYGYTDNNYILNNNDTSEQWANNLGKCFKSIGKIEGGIISIDSDDEYEMPVSEGYGDFPHGSKALIRIKPLLEHIHYFYGYKLEGEIFKNPALYNLALDIGSPEVEENIKLNPIVFSGNLLVGSGQHNAGALLRVSGGTNTNYPLIEHVDEDTATMNVKSEKYLNNDLLRTLGGRIDSDFKRRGMRFTNNISGKMKVKATISGSYDLLDKLGYIRIIIADGIGGGYDNGYTINPYSFFISEDILIDAKTTPSSTFIQTVEIEVDKVEYNKLTNNDLYFVRAYTLGDFGFLESYHNYELNIQVELIEGSFHDNFVHGNQYRISDLSLNLSEKDLLKDVMNKFNLIPVVDDNKGIVTYYTFNEFYSFKDSDDNIDVIDWSDKLIRDNKLKYNFTPKNITGSYLFENTIDGDNINLDKFNSLNEIYNQKEIKTNYNLKNTYTIENSVSSLFYAYMQNLNGLRGQYKKEEDTDGIKSVFPFYEKNLDPNFGIANDNFVLLDNSPLDGEKSVYKKATQTDIIMGYVQSTFGGPYTVNSSENGGGKMLYNENRTIDGDIARDPQGGTIPTTSVSFARPKMLSPFNMIDSSVIDRSVNSSANVFWYNNASFSPHRTTSGSSMGATRTSTDFFEMNYQEQIDNLSNEEVFMLEGNFILNDIDFKQIYLGNKILIDGRFYLINKIKNYKINTPTKVELLSWKSESVINNGLILVFSADLKDTDLWSSYLYSIDYNINFGDDGVLTQNISNSYLGFLTTQYVIGEKYKVKVEYSLISGNVTVNGFYTNGNLDGFSPINHTMSGNGSFEYEYIRTDGGIIEPFQVLSENLSIASSVESQYKITSINVYKQ